MQDPKLVAYYRVSTKRQARQWTRLGGPEHRVETYARATAGRIIKSFTEVERTADKTASHLECCSHLAYPAVVDSYGVHDLRALSLWGFRRIRI